MNIYLVFKMSLYDIIDKLPIESSDDFAKIIKLIYMIKVLPRLKPKTCHDVTKEQIMQIFYTGGCEPGQNLSSKQRNQLRSCGQYIEDPKHDFESYVSTALSELNDEEFDSKNNLKNLIKLLYELNDEEFDSENNLIKLVKLMKYIG